MDSKITGVDFNGRQTNQEIGLWIRGGSAFEDAGNPFSSTARFNNHFHNPLRPWPQAGLNDLRNGESALLWAQNVVANPDWSWQGVRRSYYKALTLEEKGDREAQFARVFAGLGHLIHLIQDMAQTAHVRNDAHPFDAWHFENGMETWARNAESGGLITTLAQTPIVPTLSLGAGAPTDGAFVPITDFWDTDQYDGSSATIATAKELTVGLAEYANANYFSEDTIASRNPIHQFPYPSTDIADYHVCADDAPQGSRGLKRWYVSRRACPAVGQQGVDHFLAESVTRNVLGPQPHAINSAFTLDDRVMEDYARDLIPRAVGYSAQLIDYFFRGQLVIEPVDPTHVRVINRSTEPLQSGTVELFADTAAGERARLPEAYVLTGPIAPGQSTPPIEVPPLAERGAGGYIAVFRGTLGVEESAVIGTSDFQWVEEWNQGLNGRHPWYQTTADSVEMNALPPGSVVQTTVSSGVIRQENTRPAGTTRLRPGPGERPSFQINQSYLGLTDFAPLNSPYRDIFPLRVTPKTDLVVKVEKMSLSAPVAVPQCPENSWGNGAYQEIVVGFDNGYLLELSVPDQQRNLIDTYNPVFIRLGEEVRVNLYEALQARGVSVTSPLAVKVVQIVQQFLPPCEPTGEEQSQVVQVDYIRLVEGP